MVEPIGAAAIIITVALVAYFHRPAEEENELQINSFFCLGICAKVDGEHHSPSTEKKADDQTD